MKKLNYAALYTLRSDGRFQGYYTDAAGKRHAVCDRDPALLYQKIAQKQQQAEASVTFADAAEQWRAIRFEQLSYKSVEAYKPVFRRLTARFGKDGLGDIQTRDVSAYLANLAAQGYAKRSVQMHRDMMRQIFNTAIGAGLIRDNPVDHAALPRGLAAGTRGIASDDALEAVKAGGAQPFGLFALVCLYAGLRRGEALALRYEDIDRAAGVIHVRRAVEFVNNRPYLKEPKTKSGLRDVLLLDVLADAIPERTTGYLFANDAGELLTKEQFNHRWEKYCVGIGHTITAHQLRHGYATILYEAGVQDKDAQQLLGHANITLTRDVYTHITDRQRDRTAARLNRYVSGDGRGEDEIVEQIVDLLDGQDAAAILAKVAAALAKK